MPTMAASTDSGRWVFTKEQLQNTPSRRCNIDYDKEIYYRQQAATLIQEMGQRLQVTQLCINTAIVYLHRFYMFHSFTKFHRNPIAACSLFLAAKVEEQPRKLEHVIRVAHMLLYKDQKLELNSEQYMEQAQELINNENILLQTLGFDVAIDHPHTQVLKCCQHLFRTSSKEMAQTSYFMATNSLHLTTMCLQYKPTVVACVCIHLVCKWFSFEIPQSSEGKDWYWYVDKSVTRELLDELTVEFLAVFNKCPARLRRRVMQTPGVNVSALDDKNSSGSSRSSSGHPDANRVKPDPSGAPQKPGERIPRSMEPRRDKAGNPIPSSSSGVPPGHRPSSSGHPPSHSNRPSESGGSGSGSGSSSQGGHHHGHHHHHHHHHSSSSGHPPSHSSSHAAPHPSGHSSSSSHPSAHGSSHPSSRPPHPHQRSSSGVKDPSKPHPSGSSSQHPSSSHQRPQQLHPQQVPSSSQKKLPPPSQGSKVPSNVPSGSTGSLFSPPRVEQPAERKSLANDQMKNQNPLPTFGQEWHDAGNQVNAAGQGSNQQNQHVNLSMSLGFSLDLDIGDDQDSGGWDINYGLDTNLLSSPNAAIDSMLSKGIAESTMSFKNQQSIFSLSEPSPKLHQPAQSQQPPLQQQQHQTPQTPQMTHGTPHLPSTPQLPVTPKVASTPRLPATPKPQIPLMPEHQQTPQSMMQHMQMQQQQMQQQQHRDSLFDLGLDNDSFTTVKTEDASMAVVDVKSTPIGEVVVTAPSDLPGDDTADGESSSGGKKKKKKKEKHKNKDKDREKDKEKKHKHKHKEKDKDKLRDKDKYKEDSPRLKVSMPSGSPSDGGALMKPVLKIKIPKGRIEGDITAPSNGSSSSPAVAAPVVPTGGLKIKISKEVLSGTTKEKDRDRERDREKDKDSRKRANTTSSSSLSRVTPSAKVPKIEPGLQQQYQQQQQQQQHHYNIQPIPSSGRPHHERNGSTNPPGEDQRDSRRSSHLSSAHRSSSSGTNKVGHSSSSVQSFPAAASGAVNASVAAAVPGSASVPPPPSAVAANAFHRAPAPGYPTFPPNYPPPGPPPPLGAAPHFYNMYQAYQYPAYQYPYQQGPHMTAMMNSHLGGPPLMQPSMAAAGVPGSGMPPLPREPPPQVPPPPPPQ